MATTRKLDAKMDALYRLGAVVVVNKLSQIN